MIASDTDLFKALSSAIAPVFLITGVSSLLASMNTRYGRVIDRTRLVLREARQSPGMVRPDELDAELRVLYRRAKLLRWTVMLAASSIFSLVLCILLLFALSTLGLAVPYMIASVFGLALIFLILSLSTFIQDFAISLQALRSKIKVAIGRNVVDTE